MFDLTDKAALVTGAGSGIGRAIAQRFAKAGARVHVGDLNQEAGSETVKLITDAGGQAEFVLLDVADEAAVVAASAKIGALDILVNNAGIGHVGTILQTESADMDRLYRVNVLGVFMVTKAFIGGMIERRRGSIINIASIGGIVGVCVDDDTLFGIGGKIHVKNCKITHWVNSYRLNNLQKSIT